MKRILTGTAVGVGIALSILAVPAKAQDTLELKMAHFRNNFV